MSRVYVFGVGFDEKLVLRSALKLGVKPGETVLLVYSTTASGEFEKMKVENALKNLCTIFSDAGVNVVKVQITATNFSEDVGVVVRELVKRGPEEVMISLGSGMRYTVFVILYSGLLYRDIHNKRARVHAHVIREDGLYDITLSLGIVRTFLGPIELKALQVLNELGGSVAREEFVKKLKQVLNVRLTSVYKLLNRMEQHGLVTYNDDIVELTPLGKSMAVTSSTGTTES